MNFHEEDEFFEKPEGNMEVRKKEDELSLKEDETLNRCLP